MFFPLSIRLLQLSREDGRVRLSELAEHLDYPGWKVRLDLARLRSLGAFSESGGVLQLTGAQRMLLAVGLAREGRDVQKFARFLRWQEFESFSMHYLKESNLQAVKHVVFKTLAGRRNEVDVVAWNDVFLMAIDCKHWARGWSQTRISRIAEAQTKRALALASRVDVLTKLGVPRPEHRSIMPVIFALGEPKRRIVFGVPVVPVWKFGNFLNTVSPSDRTLNAVPVGAGAKQSVLE